MYNRYIPQADGSYRRNSVTEPAKVSRKEAHIPGGSGADCGQNPKPPHSFHMPGPEGPRTYPKSNTAVPIRSFLRSILPKDFDTGDLMVVILLLLMSADCQEDQNTALLTLVLYLFM